MTKITVEKALLEQVIDALEVGDQFNPGLARLALRAALAEPAVNPVAWMSPNKEKLEFSTKSTVYGSHTIPLYTSHPPPAEVPLLTDEEVGMLTVFDGLHHVEVPLMAEFVRHVEAAVRQKAGLK